MKTICFFSGDITRCGGTEAVGTQIANALAQESDYKILIVSLYESEKQPFFKISDKIKHYTLFKHPVTLSKSIFSAIFKLRKFIKEKQVDILVDIDIILSLISIPATFFLKTKAYSWEHFHYHETLGCKARAIARKIAMRFSDRIIVLTQRDQANYRNAGCKVPISQIYNPTLEINIKTSYDPELKYILSIGRLTYQKGFDMIPQIAKPIFEKHPDWKWIIVGEGEDRKLIEQEIQKFKLENYIKLVGRTDAKEWYPKASIYAMTSRFEGFPMVLLETMSYKLPLIAFNCPCGPDEIISDGDNGFLISPFDVESYTEKLSLLISDSTLRQNMSDKTTRLRENLSTNTIILNWKNIL